MAETRSLCFSICTLLLLVGTLTVQSGCSKSNPGDGDETAGTNSASSETDTTSNNSDQPAAPTGAFDVKNPFAATNTNSTPVNRTSSQQPGSETPSSAANPETPNTTASNEDNTLPEKNETSTPPKPLLPPLPDIAVLESEAAALEVTGCAARRVADDTTELYLRNCLEYAPAGNPTDEKDLARGMLELNVTRGGLVLLKVSWSYERGQPSDKEWKKEIVKEEDFRKQGWTEVQNFGGSNFVFAREFATGETYRLRTKAYEPPVAYASLPLDKEETQRGLRTHTVMTLLKSRYQALLAAQEFTKLDEIADQLRKSKQKLRSRESQLFAFYDGLASIDGEPSTDAFLRHIKKLKAWKPADSPTAIIAAGLTSIRHATADRQRVSPAAYNRRLANTLRSLEKAEAVTATDPMLHLIRMMCTGTDATAADDVNRHFQAAIAADPTFLRVFIQMIRTLLYTPNLATADQVVEFIDAAVESTKEELGTSLYGILATEVQFALSRPFYQGFKSVYDSYPLSKDKVRQGYRDWDGRFPHNDFDADRRCLMVCHLEDRQLAHRLFQIIGDEPVKSYWPGSSTYRIWRAAFDKATPNGEQSKYIFGHLGSVADVTFSPDGSRFASVGDDGAVCIWNTMTGELWRKYQSGAQSSRCIAFSTDGLKLFAGVGKQNSGRLIMWNLENAADAGPEVELTDHRHAVDKLFIPANDRTFASASFSGRVRIWDMAELKSQQIYPPAGTQTRSVSQFAFIHLSADGTRLTMIQKDGQLLVIDTGTGGELSRWKIEGMPLPRAFSPDGSLIAVFQRSGSTRENTETVKIWNIADQTEVASITPNGTSGITATMKFSPDGRRLAFAQEDLLIWEFQSDKQPQRLKGHKGTVKSIAFSPDGKRLVTGGEDFSLRLWDVR